MPTMEDLATLLDVGMNEEFMLQKGKHDMGIFKITKDGIELCKENGWYPINIVESVCSGKYKIVKLPWKPKQDEEYWYSDWEDDVFCSTFNADSKYDLMLYAVGNCFRTKEEAETHKYETRNKLKSIYENGGKQNDYL